MQKTGLTPELLAALLDWQAEGKRHVQIELSGLRENSCNIWVYDYGLTSGVYVTRKEDIPTTEQLIRKQQASIEAQRQNLLKQLETLEA